MKQSRRSPLFGLLVLAAFVSLVSIRFSSISILFPTSQQPVVSEPALTIPSSLTAGPNQSISGVADGLQQNVTMTTNGGPTTTTTNTSSTETTVIHLHANARDSQGNIGYIANVKLVRQRFLQDYRQQFHHSETDSISVPPRSYLPFRSLEEWESSCMAAPRQGKERKAGWRLLTQRVQVHDDNVSNNPTTKLDSSSSPPRTAGSGASTNNTTPASHAPRILCAIYTYADRHASVTAIGETWGWKCDGFFAASTMTVDQTVLETALSASTIPLSSSPTFTASTPLGLGAVDLIHAGEEKYSNMWQKTRSIWAYMYDHYKDDFDFFYLSGDDTYVIVENLRHMLEDMGAPAQEWPLYLGHWIPDGTQGYYFCGGGPGYVLNRKTLEILVEDVLPRCLVDVETSAEDRSLGWCLRTVAGIVGNHSVDEHNAQRFHGMDPHDVCTRTGTSGYFGTVYSFWGEHYGFKSGFNLTSPASVSFHLMKTPKHLKRIHSILYQSCPLNSTLGDWFAAGTNSTL